MSENEIFGYEFRDADLLRVALTTPSYRMDHPDARDNQRLEFLGDAVLGLLAADSLYAEEPDEREGPLTVRRTHMVSSAALCAAAGRHELSGRLLRNRAAAPLPPNAKALADAIEAVIGAAWLDGGFDAAKKVFDALELESCAERGCWKSNPKGDLQVFAQGLEPPRLPRYELLGITGKSHEPTFSVRVTIEGVGSAEGKARSRRAAEAQAAAELLARTKW